MSYIRGICIFAATRASADRFAEVYESKCFLLFLAPVRGERKLLSGEKLKYSLLEVSYRRETVLNDIDVSTALSILNTLGITTIITALAASWWRDKQEFERIKQSIILELGQNSEVAKDILAAIEVHGFVVPLLRDDAWHILLTSGQLKRFGGQRVEDPVFELGYIYRKITVINQAILSRQLLVVSAVRAMGDLYTKSLLGVEDFIKVNVSETIPLIEKARKNLAQRDILGAFRSRSQQRA